MPVRVLQADEQLIDCEVCHMKTEVLAEIEANPNPATGFRSHLRICQQCAGEIRFLLEQSAHAFTEARERRLERTARKAQPKC